MRAEWCRKELFMVEQLKIGDLVRRDSEDIWRVTSIPESYDVFKDRARCLCVRAPLGWLKPDGSRSRSWAKVGDEDSFTIADIELLPHDALSATEPTDHTAPIAFPTTNRMLFSQTAPAVDSEATFPSIAASDTAGHAEYHRIEIEQSHGPVIAFEGKLLCTQTIESLAADIPRKMAIYQTAAGTLVAVSSCPADADDQPANIRASVIEVNDNVQAAHFAVLDHFNWDRQAQTMALQLGWSLRLEVS